MIGVSCEPGERVLRRMNWFDIVIIVVALSSAFLGYKIGLLRAIFLFLAFVLGIAASVQIAASPPSFLEHFFRDPNLCYIITLTIVFLLVFIGINMVGSLIYMALSLTPLKWIDSWVGVFLGLLAGILLTGLAIIYLSRLPVSGSDEWIKGSFLAPILKTFITRIFRSALDKDLSVALAAFINLA